MWGDGSGVETLAFPGRPEKPVFNALIGPWFPWLVCAMECFGHKKAGCLGWLEATRAWVFLSTGPMLCCAASFLSQNILDSTGRRAPRLEIHVVGLPSCSGPTGCLQYCGLGFLITYLPYPACSPPQELRDYPQSWVCCQFGRHERNIVPNRYSRKVHSFHGLSYLGQKYWPILSSGLTELLCVNSKETNQRFFWG